MSVVPPISAPTGRYEPFGERGAGAFPSAGDIDIWWTDPEPDAVFNITERRKSSYHFFGADQSTTVWRSEPVVLGSEADTFGVPIGPPGSDIVVANSDIRQLPQVAIDPRAGRGNRRKIFAELHSLRMRGNGMEVLAGEPFLEHVTEELGLTPPQTAQVFRRSFGEVISWDLNGDPARDFPADNHFNVFFAVKIDAISAAPATTLFNKEPLVVVDLGITSLPPLRRVTIPQFPYDMPRLYFVTDPSTDHSLTDAETGVVIAGRGGCCAHSLAIPDDLMFRPVDFRELVGETHVAGERIGINLRSGAVGALQVEHPGVPSNRPLFRSVEPGHVDGVFVPNGVTQIASTGLTYAFEDTTAGGISIAVLDGVSSVDERGLTTPIFVEAPTDALAYQPPQRLGVGLGPNGGITFDIAALRRENPDFYLVALVALAGMSKNSPRGARVRLRVLVDGVEAPVATRLIDNPGGSAAVSIDLQTAQRFVTLASTSVDGSGNGVFALMQLRGFGKLAGDPDIPYTGQARPLR